MKTKQLNALVRIIVTAVFTLFLALQSDITTLPFGYICKGLLYYGCLYIFIGYDVLRKAVLGLGHRRWMDENFLLTIATFGAFGLAIYADTGDYIEAIAVMLFYKVGEFFQSYAVARSRKSITSLMELRPDYANIEDDEGKLVQVDLDEIEAGQVIVVAPGERIPIDGIVIEGTSTLDTSALTGESKPRKVSSGDNIMSGSININGVLKLQTTCLSDESTVSRILDLIEDSASNKSRSEAFITRFARYYTPFVCFSAIGLAFLPPTVSWLIGTETLWATWIYRALIFLVISCPCALVISIPLTFFAGIGGISREGVLVKGANIVEDLAKTDTVVFDKTGTLTKGSFEIVGAYGTTGELLGETERETLISLAAHAEYASTHPIAVCVREAYGKTIDASNITDVQEISGQGVVAKVQGRQIRVGNARLMQGLSVEIDVEPAYTYVYVALENECLGYLTLGDALKPQSRQAICDLQRLGIQRSVMLSGDTETITRAVAKTLQIDDYKAELLPIDKVNAVEILLADTHHTGKLAFVGDGINDAPVMMRADIGIAMGGIGSDAAIEAADIVLLDDNPCSIATAIRHARKIIAISQQNIVLALGTKGTCLVLGSLGLANMWLAIFADVGVMILAVLNALRAIKKI